MIVIINDFSVGKFLSRGKVIITLQPPCLFNKILMQFSALILTASIITQTVDYVNPGTHCTLNPPDIGCLSTSFVDIKFSAKCPIHCRRNYNGAFSMDSVLVALLGTLAAFF